MTNNGNSVHFTITPPAEEDIEGFHIYKGTSPSFTKDATTLIYVGKDTKPSLTAAAGVTYYYAVGCYDVFGAA